MSVEINFKFERLLPSAMRGVERWRDWTAAYQELFTEFFSGEVNPILNQTNINEMSKSDISAFSEMFGFTIYNYEGYTDTLQYFQREISSIPKRIQNRSILDGYLWTYYVYYLNGTIYPLSDTENDGLFPVLDWYTNDENPEAITTLDYDDVNILYYLPYGTDTGGISIDAGRKFDEKFVVLGADFETSLVNSTLDEERVQNLDESTIIDLISRNILLNYKFLLCENAAEFISTNTAKAFYNDAERMKRVTETLYYEPIMDINFTTNNALTVTNYNYYDDKSTVANTQETMLLRGSNITGSNIERIQFGIGRHGTISPSIIGVQNQVLEISGENILTETSGNVESLRRKLLSSGTMPDFSEIALFDVSGCVLYSTFPTVRYYEKMYSNAKLSLVEV